MRLHDLLSGRKRAWWASLLRSLLCIAEVPYGWAVQVRNRRYSCGTLPVQRVGVPVVSVGNITAGGTGKTPLVAWLAEWFARLDLQVALISRGYKAQAGGSNDEARELARRLPDIPHLQNADRVAAAKLATEQTRCQLILLDDAFQHRRIHRDLDIVLIDALEPFGFRHLLPRGLLREPLSQLSRADVVGLSRAAAVTDAERLKLLTELRQCAPHALLIEINHRPSALINARGNRFPLSRIVNQRVTAFCGIGNPNGFRHSLESLGTEIAMFRSFPDHHHFGSADIAALERDLRDCPDVAAVVCTGKDLVKFDVSQLHAVPLLALEIEIEVTCGQEPLETLLHSLVDMARSGV